MGVTVLALAAMGAGSAAAQGSPPQYEHTRGISEFAFGAEVTAERAHFHRDGAGCPAPTEACRRGGYVVRGDLVVVSDAGGNAPFVKASYIANADVPATTGWLRRADLRITDTAPDVPVSSWVGRFGATPFKRGNQALSAELQIRLAPSGSLVLVGESVPTPEGRPFTQAPSAQADGPLTITSRGGIQATYSGSPRGSCDLSRVLIGPYLAVDASGHECGGEGGLRATFQGLYLRAGARPSSSGGAPPARQR